MHVARSLVLLPWIAACADGPPSGPALGLAASAPATAREQVGAPSAVPATASAPPGASAPPHAASSVDAVSGASRAAYASAGSGPPDAPESPAFDIRALRAQHLERLKSDRSPVTVLTSGTPRELGRRICEAAVPKRPAETPVLVKPNICGFHAMQDPVAHQGDDGVRGRTTDPAFVRGVVDCLTARGHTRITIADGCAVSHAQWRKLIAMSGYEAMAREAKVSLVALDDDGVFDVEGDRPGRPVALEGLADSHVPTLMLPNALVQHLQGGLFISVPKIKAHRFSVVSLGIKGMQGVVMRSEARPFHAQKWRMHEELLGYLKTRGASEDRKAFVTSLELFAERMVDVLEVATPDVVLGEGTPAEGGDGFERLTPVVSSVAIGGTNPVLVDRVGAELLGLWDSTDLANGLRGHRTSPLIEVAAKRFGMDLSTVATSGDGVALLSSKRPSHFVSIAPFGFRH